jgi:sugar-phosphatase
MSVFQCDAVIFDLDGVLVDSSTLIERHWWKWASKHGIDPAESLHAILGLTTAEGIRLVAPHLDAEVEANKIDTAEAKDTEGVTAYEGVMEMLGTIPGRWWGVATSGTRDTAVARMQTAGLTVPEVLISADDVTRGKPEPEPYLIAAQRMQVQPERCIVIEDSAGGLRSGLAAGMTVIAVASTHSPHELEMARALVKEIRDIKISINDKRDDLMRMSVKAKDYWA